MANYSKILLECICNLNYSSSILILFLLLFQSNYEDFLIMHMLAEWDYILICLNQNMLALD